MEAEISRIKALLRSLALYIEARGQLLQIEAREAGIKGIALILLAALAGGFLLFGWLLALPALVWLLAQAVDKPWWQVTLALSGLHLFFALIFLLALRSKLKRLKVLEETIYQFQRDREWIGSHEPGH